MIRAKLGLHLFNVALILFLLSGCVSPQYTPGVTKPQVYGIYHTVKAGETLWRISRIYNMDLGELVKINNISEATSIEIGQQIFIPEAYKAYAVNTNPPIEDFIWPLKGKVICKFQEVYQNMVNKGVNIRPGLERDVLASRSGIVVFYANNFKGFGKTIIVEHSDNFMTVYAGFQDVSIKVGERVARGAVIAKMGSSEKEKNLYLHFEIRRGHLAQNPIFYLSS